MTNQKHKNCNSSNNHQTNSFIDQIDDLLHSPTFNLIISIITGIFFLILFIVIFPLTTRFFESLLNPGTESAAFYGFSIGLVFIPIVMMIACVISFIKNLRRIISQHQNQKSKQK